MGYIQYMRNLMQDYVLALYLLKLRRDSPKNKKKFVKIAKMFKTRS